MCYKVTKCCKRKFIELNKNRTKIEGKEEKRNRIKTIWSIYTWMVYLFQYIVRKLRYTYTCANASRCFVRLLLFSEDYYCTVFLFSNMYTCVYLQLHTYIYVHCYYRLIEANWWITLENNNNIDTSYLLRFSVEFVSTNWISHTHSLAHSLL